MIEINRSGIISLSDEKRFSYDLFNPHELQRLPSDIIDALCYLNKGNEFRLDGRFGVDTYKSTFGKSSKLNKEAEKYVARFLESFPSETISSFDLNGKIFVNDTNMHQEGSLSLSIPASYSSKVWKDLTNRFEKHRQMMNSISETIYMYMGELKYERNIGVGKNAIYVEKAYQEKQDDPKGNPFCCVVEYSQYGMPLLPADRVCSFGTVMICMLIEALGTHYQEMKVSAEISMMEGFSVDCLLSKKVEVPKITGQW